MYRKSFFTWANQNWVNPKTKKSISRLLISLKGGPNAQQHSSASRSEFYTIDEKLG